MKKRLVLLMLCCSAFPAWATEAKLERIQLETSVHAIERGAVTLMNACLGCHALKYIKYRDLAAFGMDKVKIDEWRGDKPMEASLASLLPDEFAMQSFGLVPTDLSLITNARSGGANYVYSYLTGYYLTADGISDNHVFPGTNMPDVLGIASATDSAQRAALEEKSRDVVSFLAWAADPHEQERHKLGYYVIGYLIILTLLLYFLKNQIWSRLK